MVMRAPGPCPAAGGSVRLARSAGSPQRQAGRVRNMARCGQPSCPRRRAGWQRAGEGFVSAGAVRCQRRQWVRCGPV
jgi:hypothetical protein